MPVPPVKMATYCSPPIVYVTAPALMAAPVWKRHSSLPVTASSARKLPSNWPTKIRSLAVESGLWLCAMSRPRWLVQRTVLVEASMARMPPVWYCPRARWPLPPAPRQCATGLTP
jgi:hypothetical protein